MARRIIAALALLCLLAPAHAQKTKSVLTTEINTNWPDNTAGAITPALLRSTVLDIVNSYYDLAGGTSLSCAAHQWVSALPTLSSITCTQPGAADIAAGTFGISVLSSVATGGVGYTTGAGGAVTQITNRTTSVTLNTVTGAITLFTAAGSATPATFTVTDSAVAAADVVHVSQKSGSNLYELFVTAVAAGSFNITFFTTGGTTSDAPVFNFAVIKGSVN